MMTRLCLHNLASTTLQTQLCKHYFENATYSKHNFSTTTLQIKLFNLYTQFCETNLRHNFLNITLQSHLYTYHCKPHKIQDFANFGRQPTSPAKFIRRGFVHLEPSEEEKLSTSPMLSLEPICLTSSKVVAPTRVLGLIQLIRV